MSSPTTVPDLLSLPKGTRLRIEWPPEVARKFLQLGFGKLEGFTVKVEGPIRTSTRTHSRPWGTALKVTIEGPLATMIVNPQALVLIASDQTRKRPRERGFAAVSRYRVDYLGPGVAILLDDGQAPLDAVIGSVEVLPA